jgi:hypothetical protein
MIPYESISRIYGDTIDNVHKKISNRIKELNDEKEDESLILKNNSTLTNMMSPSKLVKYYTETGSRKPFTDAIKAFEVSEAIKKEHLSPKKMSVEQIYNHYKNSGSANAARDTLNIIKPKEENNQLIKYSQPIQSNNLKDDISFEQINPMKSSLNEKIKSKKKGKRNTSESEYESSVFSGSNQSRYNIPAHSFINNASLPKPEPKYKDKYPAQYKYFSGHKDEISIKSKSRYQKFKEDQEKIIKEVEEKGIENLISRLRGRPKKNP